MRHFKERLTDHESETVIRILGARIEQMRQAEVEHTLGRMGDLSEQQATAIEKMTRALVHRILADPISCLLSQENSAAEAVHKVFALTNE